MDFDLRRSSLIELSGALRRRQISPVELHGARARPHRRDRVVAERRGDRCATATRSCADARAAGERIARGEARPLEGVPLGVKDLEDVAGLVTSQGSMPFRDHVAARDSTQVARLRAAGAIVVGKTNTPEFGYTAITKNLVYGVTRSPWNLERTPGGSSGGSAAALVGSVLPAGDRERRRRLDPHPGELHRRVRPEAVVRPHPASDLRTLGLRRHGGLRAAHQDGRGRGALPRSGRRPLALTTRTACRIRAFRTSRRCAHRLPGSFASASRPISATPWCSRTSPPPSRKRRAVFEQLGHGVEPLRDGPPMIGREWGMLGSFELASQLHSLLPAREPDFGRAFLATVRLGWKMTPELWGEGGSSARRAQRLVRAKLRAVRSARHADGSLRSAACARSVSGRDRRPAADAARASPRSRSPSICRGIRRRPCASALSRARPADRHADRRPASPRRSRAAGGARLRARAAVAPALARGLSRPRPDEGADIATRRLF